ncbi:MAG: hypothetical protein NTV86_13740 [Planctomycetota bacterium]|nr:hypothetical protein [Planctomycetota bacterium]
MTSRAGPAGLRTDRLAIPVASVGHLSAPRKLLLLLGNTFGLLHGVVIVLVAWLMWHRPGVCAGAAVGVIYVLPPLLCRVLLLASPIRRTTIAIGSREFFTWWFAINLQMLFNRFAALEELLRIVPGCYSLWLRLWGAKVGRLTYWAAGMRILDRPFLQIGEDVTFGAGVRLNPHVIQPGGDGRLVLLLGRVRIGDHVSVGGYSLLVAGAEIASGQATRAFLMLPPFSRLEGGRRVKSDAPTPPAGDAPASDGDRDEHEV